MRHTTLNLRELSPLAKAKAFIDLDQARRHYDELGLIGDRMTLRIMTDAEGRYHGFQHSLDNGRELGSYLRELHEALASF